jgi:hypothetical protein
MNDIQLSKLLNITPRELADIRRAGALPHKNANAEEIIIHLFINSTQKTLKEQKTMKEIEKITIQNEKALGNLIEKSVVEEKIKSIYLNISTNLRKMSEAIPRQIVSDPKHLDTNKDIVKNICVRTLKTIGEYNEE